MKFVITGATSFIGLELTSLLLNNGQQVFAVCRPDSKGKRDIPKGAEVVTAEMTDYVNLHTKIKQADIFINLAWGGTGHVGRDAVDVQKENVACTIAAMRSAAQMGCKLFVETGSQAEYGSTTEPQHEDMECHPFSEYGIAKLKVKEELFKLSEQLNVKYLHLRLFSVIGENYYPWTLTMSAMEKMLKDETVDLSPCTQNWNFLYVKDAVKQIIGLCDYTINKHDYIHEVFNVASNDTRPLKDFIEEMKSISNSKSELNYGANVPSNLVSLQPDIKKTERALGFLSFTSFSDIVKLIIKKKQ